MSSKLKGKQIPLLAKTLIPQLGKKERTIARFIQNNPESLVKMDIHDIANVLNVSMSSITKVSKKLGFSGFYELKINLSNTTEDLDDNGLPAVFPYSTMSAENIIDNTFLSSILALQESRNVLKYKVITDVSSLFINCPSSNKILLAGCGGSAAICDDFHHKLLKIGIFSSVFNDSHKQLMAASLLNKGDILLVVSHSGQSTDIINMVTIANDNDAETICLTNYPNSPLSRIVKYPIVSVVKNNQITGENAVTRIVHLNILDAIFTIITSKTSQASRMKLNCTTNAVSVKRTFK
ncbi:HTH-type transcriptional regulator MurR [Commensalibacter sp. Nvir]|uniref:SIS domain-containing protein n=1 Tax=Commensalibacter sp. Nvir TaxID=3069817 RepID=UPI002D751A14|nr:HTH-type transcriptional regulator MurR [Commensalibacter sp. Nvir]